MDLIYYTGRGLPPFMTSHNLASLQLCLQHFYTSGFISSSISLPQYSGTQSSATYLSLKDILLPQKSIQGNKNYSSISITVPQTIELTLQKYMEFANEARTDYIVSFSEEASMSSGSKKSSRSGKNAVKALDHCLSLPRNSKILGNVQGGNDIEARTECLQEMKKREVDGLIIGGFSETDYGLPLRNLLLELSTEMQNYDKPIVLSGPGRPLDIVYAAQYGVTHFETLWPFKLAGQGKALNLNFSKYSINEKPTEDNQLYMEPELNLNEEIFKFQHGPLVVNCKCLACTNHHRGYIHHLLKVKEMTANTLLAMHNTEVYQNLLAFLKDLENKQKLQHAYSTFTTNFCTMKV